MSKSLKRIEALLVQIRDSNDEQFRYAKERDARLEAKHDLLRQIDCDATAWKCLRENCKIEWMHVHVVIDSQTDGETKP
jgi:hypothetical protein